MRHPEFPIVSFLSIILLTCSLPSHIRAGSVCMLALIAWLTVMSLIRGVNSVIWADNTTVRLEVWCDITTKITIGFTYAVPGCALCILRHLELVASTRAVITTREDKRRRRIFEIIMCFGVPMLFMALHYIVQGHRFDVIEDVGCVPFVYFSVAAVIIIWVPPFLMSLVTFVYAALAIRHFLRHRIEFAAHLRNSQSAISPGRYLRLMLLAVFEMIWDTGVNAYLIYFNTFTGLRPWISWDDVHSNFSRVAIFPMILIPREFISQVIWQWWIVPISCFFFFLFFGFGEEAMADYKYCIRWFRRGVLRPKLDKPKPLLTSGLPIYRPRTSVDSRSANGSPWLAMVSDDASDHEKKEWDELSLKMPHVTDFVTVASTTTISPVSAKCHSIPPEEFRYPAPVYGTTSRSLALDQSVDPTGTHQTFTPESSMVTGPSTPSSLTHPRAPPIPVLMITDSTNAAMSSTHVDIPTSSPPADTLTKSFSPGHSVSPSQQSSHRRSTSPDLEISISPAYFPDSHTPRYPESDTSIANPSSMRQTSPYPHGGISMTVEKEIV